MGEVVLKQNIFDIGECLFHGRSLRDDIDAVCVFFDHFLKATNLTFDDLQTPDEFAVVLVHTKIIIPPRGYIEQDLPYRVKLNVLFLPKSQK
jgi:hypothetical protein